MLHYFCTNWLRDEDNPPLPSQRTAVALLSSFIADGDVVTDWLYLEEIISSVSEEGIPIPKWLIILQLISCICGSLSWLGAATDGRLVYWIKLVCIWVILIPIYILALPLQILRVILERYCVGDGILYDTIGMNIIKPLLQSTKKKPSFSSGSLLLFGIIVEDIPQLIVTFLIEEKINAGRGISNTAVVNLSFAVFDILHKLAEAYDLQSDVVNSEYYIKRRIRAHSGWVTSLANIGTNQVLSTSWDKTMKLWDTTKGKFKLVQKFNCDSEVNDSVAVGISKIITACSDNRIRIFNTETKTLEFTRELNFEPDFVCLSPDSNFYFTSSHKSPIIQMFDVENNEILKSYNKGAKSITFLNNHQFVSTTYESTDAFLWNMSEQDKEEHMPVHKFLLQFKVGHQPVMVMSELIVLIGDGKLIRMFEFSDNAWKYITMFKGHTNYITSMVKVNDSLFVSTSDDKTAKLWHIHKESAPCIFTFRGHITKVNTSIVLEEEKAIATGDLKGDILIWSIEKYLTIYEEERDDTVDYQSINQGEEDSPTPKPSFDPEASPGDMTFPIPFGGDGDGDVWTEKLFVHNQNRKTYSGFVSKNTGKIKMDEPPSGASQVIYRNE